jgi:hypothetical protein
MPTYILSLYLISNKVNHMFPFSSYFFINKLSFVVEVIDLKSRIYFCDLNRYALSF